MYMQTASRCSSLRGFFVLTGNYAAANPALPFLWCDAIGILDVETGSDAALQASHVVGFRANAMNDEWDMHLSGNLQRWTIKYWMITRDVNVPKAP
jgi:hypothetical protein